MLKLEGKRLIVTGGARGIGEAVVRAYAAAGARVVSVDMLDDLGAKVAREATETGPGTVRYIHVDVSDRQSVEAAFSVAREFLGGLDGLAHIAAVHRAGPGEETTDEDWNLIMNVNVRGTFLTNQAAYSALRDAGGGVIINFGSDSGLAGEPGAAAYSASKGAVHSWTRTIAREWGRHNIRVNAVAPAMHTPMFDERVSALTPAERAAYSAGLNSAIVLGGKMGDPHRDLAPVMVFLASEDARYITSQIIAVNGGVGSVR